ncbi:uncharacterized protein LOC126235486 [Schistocerca nitens]|uniref:uncharacterized protein LOC126235486 n=1 Tax=Schistocerca nitens TaxID=7011 RepID=UPI002118243B|nr:uncharacterized protein LOC126235486 [Schistocerca nitens]
MSALWKLISGSSKAGACGRHILEFASHDEAALCRQVHASPALQKSPDAAAMSRQPGRAGLRTSLPLTKPIADRSAAPPPERPQIRIDPSLLNLQETTSQQSRNRPGRAKNQSKDSTDK